MPVTGILSISPSVGAGVTAACANAKLARVVPRVVLTDLGDEFEGGCGGGSAINHNVIDT